MFLLATAANHAWYKPIFLLLAWNGSMLFFLESIWQRDSIIILFTA